MTITTYSTIAGTIGQAHFAAAKSLLTVTPGPGATATLEYTLADRAAILNKTAVWAVWPKGVVTSPETDILNENIYARLTSIGGPSSFTVDQNPSLAQMQSFLLPFGTIGLDAVKFGQNTSAIGIAKNGAGTVFSLASIPRSAPLIVAFGDSTLAYMSQFTVTCTSLVNNFDGTATIGFSGSQGIVVGDDIGVQGAQNEGFKVISAKVLAVNGNAYTYPITGNPPASDGATPSAIIRYPYRGSSAGPLAWTNAFLGRKLNIVNAAQVGDTTSKMLARFDQDIAPLMPDRVTMTASVNDAWAATSAPTLTTVLATMKSNTLAILAKCKAIGAALDIITGFPQPADRPSWSTFGRDCFVQYRKWLVQLAKSEELFCLVWGDASAGSSQVQNAIDANGAPNAGMSNADKIHPLSTACYIAGKQYAQFLSIRYSLPLSPANIRAITDIGLFAGTTFTGIFTGTAGTKGAGVNGVGPLATGLTVTISTGTPAVDFAQTARAVATDGDTAGNWQAVMMTATAAGDKVTVAFPNLVSQLANGDIVDIKGLARVLTGATLCKDVSLSFVSQTATAGNLNVSNLLGGSVQQGAFPESFSITLGAEAPVRAAYNGYNPGAPSAFTPMLSFTAASAGTIILELACWSADKL